MKKRKISTLEIEIKLLAYFKFSQNIIVHCVADGIYHEKCGFLHECDLLVLSKSNYATEIEIKISKSDLIKDSKKEHAHESDLIKKLYFAVQTEYFQIFNAIPTTSVSCYIGL